MRDFELELRWPSTTLAATLGTLEVSLPDGAALCAPTLEALQATAVILQSAIDDIERMAVGDMPPLVSDEAFGDAYDAMRLLLPRKLHERMQLQLAALKLENVFLEIRGYKEEMGSSYVVPLGGLFALLGRPTPTSWEAARQGLTTELRHALVDLNTEELTIAELRHRWAASCKATKRIDLEALLRTATAPVQALMRWVLAVRLLMQVLITIHEEAEGAPGDDPEGEEVAAELRDAGVV